MQYMRKTPSYCRPAADILSGTRGLIFVLIFNYIILFFGNTSIEGSGKSVSSLLENVMNAQFLCAGKKLFDSICLTSLESQC